MGWLPVSSGCFLHTAARGSFPKWTRGFSDTPGFSDSRGSLRGAGAEGLAPAITSQFFKRVIWKCHSSWATAGFRWGKKEKKEKPTAVWDSGQEFR